MNTEKLRATFDELQSAIARLRACAASSRPPDREPARKRIGDLGRLMKELRRQYEGFSHQAAELSRLATIVDCSDDAILSKDLNGIIQSWNKAAERLFGYSCGEILGQSIQLLIPPERIEEEAMILRRVRQGRRTKHYETVRRCKDGTLVDVSVSISPIRDAAGRVRGAAKVIRDISERKASEMSMRDGERRMRALVETAVDAIITIDDRGMIESINPATERLFGYSAAELQGHNVSLLMPEPYRSEHNGYLAAYIKTGQARIIGIGREVPAMRKDGSTFPMSLAVSEVALAGRRLFTGIIHDLRGRRQLERQILDASANEQRRIGQDLHDGLCQDLIGIAFGTDHVARQLAARSLPESLAVERLSACIREAAGQARRLSHGLNPVDLKAGGLPGALEALAARISESFGVSCAFEWDGRACPVDDDTATHLYRIAQESVTNALKHGKARRIQISLRDSEARTLLTITDDGVGVPLQIGKAMGMAHGGNGSAPAGSPLTGIGLQGMRYRANLMGGIFAIRPGDASGAVVECAVPSSPGKARKAETAGNNRLRRNGKTRKSLSTTPKSRQTVRPG